jgi:hypothetical protein
MAYSSAINPSNQSSMQSIEDWLLALWALPIPGLIPYKTNLSIGLITPPLKGCKGGWLYGLCPYLWGWSSMLCFEIINKGRNVSKNIKVNVVWALTPAYNYAIS